MNCEEKLEEAKRLYESANDDQKYVLEDLFPELKDSEDEKIKNQIISFLEGFERDHYKSPYFSSWITWLKKQGEQKTNNNFEPKFKVGDWIIGGIHDKPTQITKIEKEGYVIDRGWIGSSFAEDMHLWTLQDAKDGDVLVSKYSQPFIYNGNYNLFHVGSYCGLSVSSKFIVSTSKCFWTENMSIRPATKEQRELLFKEMKEAGYEWDSEKKELKKIDTFCQENCKGFQETGKCFADGECKAKKEAEQKSTWSEEDEIGLGDALWCCKQAASIANDENDMGNVWFAEQWLKSLKDRVQPQQEWSEEDEERIKNILSVLGVQVCWNGATGKKGNPYQKEIDWLKSLKPQNHWKPTEAQLASLTIACDRNDMVGFDLTQLLQELKKL